MFPRRLAIVLFAAALAACQRPPPSSGPRLIDSKHLESRYGLLTADGPRLTLDGRVVLTGADFGGATGDLYFHDLQRVGELDLIVIGGPASETCDNETVVLEVGPGQAVRRLRFDVACPRVQVVARAPDGLTFQLRVRGTLRRPDPLVCTRYRPGRELHTQPCSRPLTRADDRPAAPDPPMNRLRLSDCRSPSVVVDSVRGLDGPNASLSARQTPATARSYCEWQAEAGPEFEILGWDNLQACIRRQLAEHGGRYAARADCRRRTITDLNGDTFRYAGLSWGDFHFPYDRWVDAAGEEMLPSCAGVYQAIRDQYARLCPNTSGFLLLD